MSDLRTGMGISSIDDVIRYNVFVGLVVSDVCIKGNSPEISEISK